MILRQVLWVRKNWTLLRDQLKAKIEDLILCRDKGKRRKQNTRDEHLFNKGQIQSTKILSDFEIKNLKKNNTF